MHKNINRINDGVGFDNIHSNHLKHTGVITRKFISKLFTAMLCHGYVPKEMLRGHIKPRIKNSQTCGTKSDNYRPVMSSSVLLKLFEYSVLEKLTENIKINDLQFGFTEYSSCANAITFLKDTILYYTEHSTPVHAAGSINRSDRSFSTKF